MEMWLQENERKCSIIVSPMEGKKRSGDDCNCETLARGDAIDIGVTTNELGSRIQEIADSHDSSPTLRLSEENMTESTDHFLSQTNSSIDST